MGAEAYPELAVKAAALLDSVARFHPLSGGNKRIAWTLKRLLDANGQSLEIAQHAILANEKRVHTVVEVIQEHIDLLIRPSSGTTKAYQTMLDLHIGTLFAAVLMLVVPALMVASCQQVGADEELVRTGVQAAGTITYIVTPGGHQTGTSQLSTWRPTA